MSLGNCLESLSQAILVGIILVGRLGVGRDASAWLAAGNCRMTRIEGLSAAPACGLTRLLCIHVILIRGVPFSGIPDISVCAAMLVNKTQGTR